MYGHVWRGGDGMLKVTIQLPNGAIITLEADEPQTYLDVIAAVKHYVLLDDGPGSNGHTPVISLDKKITTGNYSERPNPNTTNGNPPFDIPANPEFFKFCQELTPLGDMRRVIAVTEGARQFLGIVQVSCRELEALFDALQWPKPKDFILTLRNAGRSKFRWLQRVPGHSGYYTITDLGRQEILPPAMAPI